ncbi:hypothetical protein JYG23_05245 [Sedimentibacter sp. zth1]|uniref:ABC transporter substrate-binding protein n=1 Tax=Sedimentibacter sp. zth1 TaxID=2816908 RepID=UPI001A9124C7|nr:ABC transporter substrate-binding protein [Sedimentibacter sp. zth1]QSX06853.1 hypothetical protein JYG23_05245 [Sedimentibacter sp. zth1]
MKNTKFSKVLRATLGLILVFSLMISSVACGKDDNTDPKDNSQPADNSDNKQVTDTEATYTFNEVVAGSPDTWNPHEWETHDDSYIMDYTTMGLYDFALAEDKESYVIVPEMAAAEPVDVTSEYAGDERFGVPADATEGYAYKVPLNQEACWENGTKINADTYIYSMQQILSYQMKNYRANDEYAGNIAVANAEKYYKQQSAIYTDIYDGEGYRDVADSDMKFSFVNSVVFFGDSAKDYYSANVDCFTDADGNDIYEKYSKEAYYDLTDEAKADLLVVALAFGDDNPEAYKEFCFTYDGMSPEFSWDNVGYIKTGEYELTVVLGRPATPFYFKYAESSIPLVYEELYEENKKETGDIIKTSYGTSVDKYMSYGPYKLTEFQDGKVIKMTKNDNWYGYNDGKHEGQYQTTDIVCQIVVEQATQLQLFLQGRVDVVDLVSTDMDKYRTSDYVVYTPQTYTSKVTMNSSKAALKSRETEGINKSIQSYIDFRHAMSLCFDREGFASQCTATHSPGFGIINAMYIYDPDAGIPYRSSTQAQETLCTLYGVDNVDDITGYDKDKAAELFTSAYNDALAAGDIKETDKVELEFLVYNTDEALTKMVIFLQNCIDAATVDTPLENRVSLVTTPDQDYYDHAQTGMFEMIFSTWGGNPMNPFNMMECYCVGDKLFEYGFKPEKETLTINVNGEEVTKTFFDWFKALNEGEYLQADMDTRLEILAKMELGLLETYNCPPLYYRTTTTMRSQKINYATYNYVNLVAFGGIRGISYNYTDKEWDAYCKENNNQLQY